MKNYSHTVLYLKGRAKHALVTLAAATLLILSSPARPADSLAGLSIEELMNIEVTSVSKKAERVADAPAAVTVITGEDIRRSGYSSIPDVLRLVPGLEVAQIDLNTWAITARGFNGQFASKLLVLIDGRSVYSPLYSGVFWDAQDVLLEDVERIEVIRGPGATMWGANAVNGVINIITKKAESTQGTLVSAGGGSAENYAANARYGGTFNGRFAYRVYAKSFDRYQSADATTAGVDDKWQTTRVGFRLDGPCTPHANLTVLGETFSGIGGYTIRNNSITPPYNSLSTGNNAMSGGHLLANYQLNLSPTSEVILQGYADHLDNDIQTLGDHRTNVDVNLQHRFSSGARHEVVWGTGYHYTWDHIYSGLVVTVPNARAQAHLLSLFAQDEIQLARDKAWLTLGSKTEHNEYTGYEIQPNARLSIAPHHNYRIWSAVSRAVRTPSRGENDGQVVLASLPPFTQQNPSFLPVLVTTYGNKDMQSEVLIAYELGVRANPVQNASFALSTFYHDFKRLRSTEYHSPIVHMQPPYPYVEIPMVLTSNFEGNAYGLEFESESQLAPAWRLHGNYTYLIADITDYVPVTLLADQPGTILTENVIPRHQALLRTTWNPTPRLEVDVTGRFVDRLTNTDIKSYTTADCRLGFELFDGFQLFAAGQNLIGPAHIEFDSPLPIQSLKASTERTISLGANWKFQSERSKVQISKR